jgi:hypothetical protein
MMPNEPIFLQMLSDIKASVNEVKHVVSEVDRKQDEAIITSVKHDARISTIENRHERNMKAATWIGAPIFLTILGWFGIK